MIAGPHQIDIENSSTIEGILKRFKSTPPQNEVEISITIEERKIFFQKGYTKAYVPFQYY